MVRATAALAMYVLSGAMTPVSSTVFQEAERLNMLSNYAASRRDVGARGELCGWSAQGCIKENRARA
jgi:hypothetical protein